ncbi:MAG: Hpt domain-containing protein [Pseudomonadota bacterium]
MSSAREHFALEWIKSDLFDTLNEARTALDEYAELGGEDTRMRVCLTALHQVHGTLLMLELEGVTLLADHLEQLAQGLLGGSIVQIDGAREALMQGILELPGYIEELLRGVPDGVSPMLTLVNEIRRYLNLEPMVDEAGASLIEGAGDAAVEHFVSIDGAEKVTRIRRAYQSVLLNILKGEDRSAAVTVLEKIAAGLQKVTEGSAHQRQWQAFGEFVASLAGREGALEAEAVKLLRRADLELKDLAKDGPAALRKPANVDFVQQLLQATLDRDHQSEVLDGLRQAVARDVENNTLAISGRQAMGSAAGALRDELAVIKDRLDMLVRAEQVDLHRLRDIVEPLQRMASTLSLLGFESSRAIVADQVDAVENLVVLGDGDPENVVSIAGALVQVDENLASTILSGGQSEVEQITSEAQLQVLRESRRGLETVKQNVVDFVSAQFEVGHLQGIDAVFQELSGALAIIPLPRIIAIVDACAVYLDKLRGGHRPDWTELDHFADVISAVDYYLERLAEESPGQLDEVLAVAQRGLSALQIEPAEVVAPAPQVVDQAPVPEQVPSLEQIVDEPVTRDAQAAADTAAGTDQSSEAEDDTDSEPAYVDPDVAIKLEREEDANFDLGGAAFADLEGSVEAPVFGAPTADEPVVFESSITPKAPEEWTLEPTTTEFDEQAEQVEPEQAVEGAPIAGTPDTVDAASIEPLDLDALQTPEWEATEAPGGQDQEDAEELAPIEFQQSETATDQDAPAPVSADASPIGQDDQAEEFELVIDSDDEADSAAEALAPSAGQASAEAEDALAHAEAAMGEGEDTLAAQGAPTEAEISLLEAEGSLSEADGSLSEAEGSLPEADGSLPEADGSLPEAEGSLFQADGSLPEAEGSLPEAEGSLTEADGSLFQADGSLPEADGSLPEADGSLPEADGSLPEADGSDFAQALTAEVASQAPESGAPQADEVVEFTDIDTLAALDDVAAQQGEQTSATAFGSDDTGQEADDFHLEFDADDAPAMGTPADASEPEITDQPTAPVPQVPLAANAEDEDEIDEEILEIFAEEVDEVLEAIDEALPIWAEQLQHPEALSEVRRAFHTLKGSGRIVRAAAIGELSWAVENMLNRLIEGTVEPRHDFVDVVNQARGLMPRLRDAFVARQPGDLDAIATIIEQADVLASGGELGADLQANAAPASPDRPAEPANDFAALDALENNLLRDEEADASLVDEGESLFFAEAQEHLDVIAEENARIPWTLTPALARAWHTLSGTAAVAQIEQIQLLAEPTYQVVEAYRSQATDAEIEAFLRDAHTHVQAALIALREARAWEEPLEFVAQADDILARGNIAPLPSERFVKHPATATLFDTEEGLHAFLRGERDVEPALKQSLGALLPLAHELGISALADTLEAFSRTLSLPKADGAVTAATAGMISGCYELLLNQVNELVAGDELTDGGEQIEALAALTSLPTDHELAAQQRAAADAPEAEATLPQPDKPAPVEFGVDAIDIESLAMPELETDAGNSMAAQPEAEAEVHAQAAHAEPLDAADIDPDLVEVFFDEAEELCEQLEGSIFSWSKAPENRIYMEDMLRGLHTFKGGARLCGLVALGDLAHNFESLVIEVQNNVREVDAELFAELNRRYDELNAALQQVKQTLSAQDAATEVTAQPAPIESAVATAPDEEPIVEPRPAQEMVRVGSLLLEDLVNLAGESSILRARIEQGMSDFTVSLDEMETTIERLREQLRRLEIETETQILFRHENSEGPSYENFDPLEMDRYSQLQQLSRSLSESASDMLDLKETLLFKARESETLLLQQARINTELQEGLMRTRMVPFSRLVPRLRRIVRQVAGELDKTVDFHVQNAEGELDRNLLERMVPALEHMLRNAVDHGIEEAELRRNFGKPQTGRIDLMLSREGGDVVLEISDDGAGIDVESVRAKAVERGLVAEDAQLTDEEMLQFILAPGFTTAKLVTQISGRGVGMDVVHSEVKQLGGSINIASRPGRGTRFTLRVPFTVSVNRALMVSVNDDLYAIPLNMIEGIVLLSTEQISDLYNSESKTFEYAGVPYRVRYLGQYLGREYRGIGMGQSSVPVVLVRSGDHAVAVHVDSVQGSREIVVKSLGPQFAGVGGISGATILGDGSVVVILDLLALIRAQQHQNLRRNLPSMTQVQRSRCVMVVDDSVTVRKVTSRLLERQGMDVLVAKDGVEAVAMLAERKPDVMLLDIEMPRMDGFEVARQVRRDDRLGNLPIVMISSRTGDKHKEHANQLGVNRFLGKPFQENELLATIDELVSSV